LRESQWFNVNISKALPVIRDVYSNYDEYKLSAQQLQKYNKENFGLKNMTILFDDILSNYDVYNKIQPKMKAIQLPKLKKIEIPKLKKVEVE
jgi:hypothetical protein